MTNNCNIYAEDMDAVKRGLRPGHMQSGCGGQVENFGKGWLKSFD